LAGTTLKYGRFSHAPSPLQSYWPEKVSAMDILRNLKTPIGYVGAI
jgi:hypothetical protein